MPNVLDLDQLTQMLKAGEIPPELVEELEDLASAAGDRFVPSPGPQTRAYYSPADVLLYGGEGGGGKTGLIIGLSLTAHRQSLLMRRIGTDMHGTGGVIEETLRMYGSRSGFSGAHPPTLRTPEGRMITFGAAQNLGDEQKFQGRARDFLGVDEATQFLEQQVRFLMGWVRTIHEGQRTRTVLATNPPLDNRGDWIVGMFRPWLDLTHENPAEDGELRWFVTVKDGEHTVDVEVPGPEPFQHGTETLLPTSRTFIRARLTDNPFIVTADYQKQLDALPEPFRSAVRDGNFMAARKDRSQQTIPTEWVRAAQARWTDSPPAHSPMTALAVDPAQGGSDDSVLAARYDYWFAPLVTRPGAETPSGNEIAGMVIAARRNGAVVVIDMGGGYGGGAKLRLEDNGVEVTSYKGASGTKERSRDGQFGFHNVRAAAYWRLREELDPSQPDGAVLALPPDPILLSDLTATSFEVTKQGIKITPKEDVVKELGRSPDRGDAVAMANYVGPRVETHGREWGRYSEEQGARRAGRVTVNLSRSAARRIGPRR